MIHAYASRVAYGDAIIECSLICLLVLRCWCGVCGRSSYACGCFHMVGSCSCVLLFHTVVDVLMLMVVPNARVTGNGEGVSSPSHHHQRQPSPTSQQQRQHQQQHQHQPTNHTERVGSSGEGVKTLHLPRVSRVTSALMDKVKTSARSQHGKCSGLPHASLESG